MIRQISLGLAALTTAALMGCTGAATQQADTDALPRGEATAELNTAMDNYLAAVAAAGEDLHSVMVLQHGKVLEERWLGEGNPDSAHILNSVSKTFTSTAVGLAISEGKLQLTDRLVSFFPDQLPETPSDNLQAITVRDLLTMNCGHDTDPTGTIRNAEGSDWVKAFLAYPVDHKPGTYYCYNSLGTYMLSAIVQKVTGEKVVDYLYPRLFQPLGIDKPRWDESPQGINCGGWGLYLKTEDLAKMGQLLLQHGQWNGRQLLPAEWVAEASKAQVASVPAGTDPQQSVQLQDAERSGNLASMGEQAVNSDWLQGYGYQMWRCRHNAFRADGANGQYILVLPDQDAVIVTTAHIENMQEELNLIWDNLLPALQ